MSDSIMRHILWYHRDWIYIGFKTKKAILLYLYYKIWNTPWFPNHFSW